jgi:oligopeptide/dipeptide ABC transporter ATP-binding protein
MVPLLEVKNLQTYLYVKEGVLKAIDDVSFEVNKGEILGIVGESGSGKSMTALSVMRLLPEPPAKIVGGQILLDGEDLVTKSEKEMNQIRGQRMSMVFQDPLSSLNPVMKVGDQIAESIRSHQKVSASEARKKAIESMELVGIPNAADRADSYPFQFSGGMRQRVMIAMGVSCSPELLIADEPTTSLDVTIQAQILELMRDLRSKLDMSVIFISHNLGLVSWICDRVIVMYAGKVMETSDVESLFAKPKHPYTEALLKAVPGTTQVDRLYAIPGAVPNLIEKSPTAAQKCLFSPRCQIVKPVCSSKAPELVEVGPAHRSRCLKYTEDPKW